MKDYIFIICKLLLNAMNGKVAYRTVAEMECHRLKALLMDSLSEVHPGADSVRVTKPNPVRAVILNMRYVVST